MRLNRNADNHVRWVNHNALLEATYDGKGKMVILRQSANGT
jgi:hypothetical protein